MRIYTREDGTKVILRSRRPTPRRSCSHKVVSGRVFISKKLPATGLEIFGMSTNQVKAVEEFFYS